MKKTIFGIAIILGLMFAAAGCGKDKNETKAGSAKSVVSAEKKQADVVKRKKAFEAKLETLKQYGLDINQTADSDKSAHFLIEVKDAEKSIQALLNWLNAGNTSPRDRKALTKLFINMKHFGMDVDWVKYAENRPQSVFVYLVGSGKEKEPFKSLIKKQALGVYLSYGENDILKEAAIKDIDSKLTVGNMSTKVLLKGAKALISKMPTSQDTARKMQLKFGIFHYVSDTNYTTENNKTAIETIRFSYKDGGCNIDKSNSYLGEVSCSFPTLVLGGKKENKEFEVGLEALSVKGVTTAEKGKLQSNGFFSIDKIKVKTRKNNIPTTGALNNLKVEVLSKNLDESLVKELYVLASTAQKDNNETIDKTMKLVGDMFSKGLGIEYLFTVASIEGETGVSGQKDHLKVEALKEKGTVTFTETYDFEDMLTLKSATVTNEKKSDAVFALKGLKFGTQVKKLYNFMPGFMEFAGALAKHSESDNPEPTKEEMQKLAALGAKMMNSGFSMAYSPLSIEGVEMADQKVKYGKMQLDLDATLKPNNIKPDNAMAMMMLLGFLQADGKLVLNKSDLESMSNSFSPSMMAMVMMYAKYEGDKAVFVLKFEKGHLLVNDKPVM